MAIKTVRAQSVGETDIVYVGETLAISWDFYGELEGSEEVASRTVVATDSDGNDVTDTVVDSHSIASGEGTNSKVIVVMTFAAQTTYKVVITATVSAEKVPKAIIYIPCRTT